MKKLFALLALMVLAGCGPNRMPGVSPVRAPQQVAASFGRTWDATINEFASHLVRIQTIDRSSGLIVSSPVTLDSFSWMTMDSIGRPHRWADCGSGYGYDTLSATDAYYNAVVQGDSIRSTVQVYVRWVWENGIPLAVRGVAITAYEDIRECASHGVFEAEMEKRIATAALRRK